MFSHALIKHFSESLQAQYMQQVHAGQDSGSAFLLIAQHLNALQDRRPRPAHMNNENGASFFMVEAVFREVLDSTSEVPVDNLAAMYNLVFPPMPAGLIPFYTQDQIMRLARALLARVERIAFEQEWSRLSRAVPSTPAAEVECMDQVLLMHADAKIDEIITHTPGTDAWGLARKVSDLVDTLDVRETLKTEAMGLIDFELEQALAQTFGKAELPAAPARAWGLPTTDTTADDYQIARALALSQAMADDQEAQFQRDLELAMATSMQDN